VRSHEVGGIHHTYERVSSLLHLKCLNISGLCRINPACAGDPLERSGILVRDADVIVDGLDQT
jgi:hypothetical protein